MAEKRVGRQELTAELDRLRRVLAAEPKLEGFDGLALAVAALGLLNRAGPGPDWAADLCWLIKVHTGFDAVGLRLRDGDDYPYYQAVGFPAEFVRLERRLCLRDDEGRVVFDRDGRPRLECLCGRVIRGRTEPDRPFFTDGGSFWTNSTTRLLAEEGTGALGKIRNRCHQAGYETVALIPIRTDQEIVGLLQIGHTRENALSPGLVRCFEGLAAGIGAAAGRLAVEEELRRHQRLISVAEDLMALIDRDFVYRTVNAAYEKSFGKRREEIVGKTVAEIVGRELFESTIRACLERCLAGEEVHFESWVDFPVTGRRYVRISCYPYRPSGDAAPEVVVSISDFTSRKLVEDDLVNYRRAVESSADLIAAVGSDHTYLLANRAFLSYHDLKRKEVIGRHVSEVVGSEIYRSTIKPHLDRCFAGESVEFEIRCSYPKWGERDIAASYYPLTDPDGRVTGVVALMRDVTEHKQAQQKLRRWGMEFTRQARELEEANTALKVLLEHLEREKAELQERIRATVNELILPFLEKLKATRLDSSQRGCIESIESNLSDMVAPFASVLSSALLKLTPSEIQVASLIRDGRTTKEIAQILNVSPDAVSFHRKNIRAKLNLKYKKTNLTTYLRSLSE